MSINAWKQCVLGAYYGATLPARRRAATLRARQQAEPVRILFYHRVADNHPNAWTMGTRRFAAQIEWLRKRYDLVSLAEAQSRISSGRNSMPTASITFDDGYAENMHFAVPLLLRLEVPFTYFVSTNHVLGGAPFPHDMASGCPLAPNTPSHLKQLAAAGAELGAHTRSHIDLGAALSVVQLDDEIAGCKSELEDVIDKSVRYFAFPYGQHRNMSSVAFQVARDAGYDGVCSAYGAYNFPGDDAFHLRRIHADSELFRFKNWMTVDPRKVRRQRDFDPGDFKQRVSETAMREGEMRRRAEKERSGTAPGSARLPISLSPSLDSAKTDSVLANS